MKKNIALALVLLLLLTACRTVPDSNGTLLGSTPSSSSVTPSSNAPSSSVPPSSMPATNIPATSVPTTTPPESVNTGYTFVYKGNNPFFGVDPDLSGCTVSHLYWIDISTEEVTPILEEPVLESIQEGAFVYYVKEDEPTKIYRTPIGEFSQHKMIYESTYGKVSEIHIDTHIIREQLVLQFVADNKRFCVLDVNTGEAAVLTQQYYIRTAMFDAGGTDTWEEQDDFVFWGKLDENDSVKSYRYFIDTGEIRVEQECAD